MVDENDRTIGVITFEVTDYVEITLLCSNKDGLGIGSTLIKYAINFALENKLECKLNSVPKAYQFYLKSGFTTQIDITNISSNDLIPMCYQKGISKTITFKNKNFIDLKKEYCYYTENCYKNNIDVIDFDNFVKLNR